MWDPYADLWERSFSALEQYARRVGDASPPKGTMEDGLPIARWVFVQRTAHKRGKLDRERTRRLEALPRWIWDANETAWREKFELLRAVAAETGDANLRTEEVVDGVALGSWIDIQRGSYKKDKLRADRRTLLEELPGWEWDARKAAWAKRYRALERYVAETGHAAPPSSVQINGIPLGQWVTNLRQSHRKGRLSAEGVEALERLPGWRWAAGSA